MSQLVQRLGIHYQRGRDHVQSPDPFYQAKMEEIKALKERMQRQQSLEVLLYLDELTRLAATERGVRL
jgi:hypothetical protein